MNNQERLISFQLDEAREMEEHYRGLLLFWKQRRQRLEAQLQTDGIFSQILRIAQKAWGKNDVTN